MSLSEEERKTLVTLELQKAYDAYEDIGILRQAGRWSGAANRLYYSVFHAVNALFIHDGLQSTTHKGSHALFNLHYIKTGVLPSDFGWLYNNLQTLREKSDYNCYFNVTEQEIVEGIDLARSFIETIDKLINKDTL